jgi:hypothetical protein
MTGKQRKLLSPELLSEALAQITALARAQGVRIALLGGYALQFYGSDRLTADIDVAADARLTALPPGTALSFGGEETFAPNGVPVDLVVRNDDYTSLYEDALQHASHLEGSPAPVVTPEHLAAMKLAAGRDKDGLDLSFLLSSGAVDPAKARAVIKQHLGVYAAQEFDRIVDEVAWKVSRGRL